MIWTVFIWKINWAFSCIVCRLQATNIGLRCNLIFSVHWNKISSETSPSMSILYNASRMTKVKSEQLKYKTKRGLAWGWTRFMVLLGLSQVWSDNYFMMFNTDGEPALVSAGKQTRPPLQTQNKTRLTFICKIFNFVKPNPFYKQ